MGWAALCLISLMLLAGTIRTVDRVMRERAIAEGTTSARGDAAILAAGLNSELDKFSLLPIALADDPQVRELLSGATGQAAGLNRRLERLARQSNAAAIYVMDSSGLTLAASNWNQPTSFVGSNYAFRRYFRDAMVNSSASQFALGTVSRKEGLYMAQRVGPASDPQGIVAVKVEFDQTEANWRSATAGVYVTDAGGVVLLASDESWRFHIAPGTTKAKREPGADLRQFGIANLPALAIAGVESKGDVVKTSLLDTEQPVSPTGWELHLLVDPEPRVAAAVASGRLAVALILGVSAALVVAIILLRRRRQRREDVLVAQRTQTLRDQLLQANRLATLGQVSAGVGHEIAQPVAAVRIFAESGGKLLDAGREKEAKTNFAEIVGLTDRIGRITEELRRFSRRQPGDRRVLAIGEAIEGAVLLLRDRVVSERVDLALPDQQDRLVEVVAEHVRLEQVLVNLLQNAFDATAANEDGDRRVSIELAANEGDVRLSVIDNGHGLASGEEERLFQPFATHKADGLGLGLVISKEIMRDLGGDLQFEQRDKGAGFIMTIPRAT